MYINAYTQMTDSEYKNAILEKAKDFKNKGDLDNAEAVLKKYHALIPSDFEATWLYAQTAYQNKNFDMSILIYQEALELQPKNYPLKLDFGKMLLDIGEYDAADTLIDKYLKFEPGNVEALMCKTRILYREGKYDETFNSAGNVLSKEPGNKEAKRIREEIEFLKIPWFKFNFSYFNDNQPMSGYTPSLEGGLYLGAASFINFKIQPLIFERQQNTLNINWLQVENRIRVGKEDLDITLGAGIIKYPDADAILTGKLRLDKVIERKFLLSLFGERKPYVSTIASFDTTVIQNYTGASIELLSKDNWTGKLAGEGNIFADDNFNYSLYSWVLSPSLKISDFDFKFGAGMSWSTSKHSRFVSEKTLEQIESEYTPSYTIKGIYKPYFTPQSEYINTAIAKMIFHPMKEFQLGLNVNFGFIALNEKPFLYLAADSSNNKYMAREFTSGSFQPWDVTTYLIIQPSKKFSLSAEFNYTSTSFFIRRYLGLGFKMHFFND